MPQACLPKRFRFVGLIGWVSFPMSACSWLAQFFDKCVFIYPAHIDIFYFGSFYAMVFFSFSSLIN